MIEMKAVILAAGQGVRISDLDVIPKCLMKIQDRTLLEKQVSILKKCKIDEIVVVIGARGKCWSKNNIDTIRKIHKNVVINEDNLNTTSTYSLYLGLKKLSPGPFIVLDGDVVFEERTVRALLDSEKENILVSEVTANPTELGSKILLKGDRVISVGRQLESDNVYLGLMKCGKSLFDYFVRELSKKEYRKIDFSFVLDKCAKENVIHNLPIHGYYSVDSYMKPLTGGSFAYTREVTKLVQQVHKVVRKEAYEGREKLIDEITWLLGLPDHLRDKFPKILSYDVTSYPVYFEMPHHDYPTLRRLLIDRVIDGKKALGTCTKITDFLFKEVYVLRRTRAKPGYVKNIHLKRITERVQMTRERSKIMRKIIDAEKVKVNGKEYENILHSVERISRDKEILDVLQPKETSMVHGDLHFDNILVNLRDPSDPKFILVDPRGLDYTYHFTYDLGKLWHSFHGLYDFLHEGLFDLKVNVRGKTASIDYSINDHPALKEYKKIYNAFPKMLLKYPQVSKDKTWLLKTLLSETSHFCSVMPFHLRKDEEEKLATALYAVGVWELNEFLDEWNKR